MGVVISNIMSPAGINAGKPIAKTLRLGAALAINPTEALITSSPNTTGKPIAAAPINIVPDQLTSPISIAPLIASPARGTASKLY